MQLIQFVNLWEDQLLIQKEKLYSKTFYFQATAQIQEPTPGKQ